MIVLRLWGGLGNQLFQFAFGFTIAKKLNKPLFVDTTFYLDSYLMKNKRFTRQKFQLNNFDLSDLPIKVIFSPFKSRFISLLQNIFINKLLRIFRINFINSKDLLYIKEISSNYSPSYLNKIINSKSKIIYLDGYWQSEKYFSQNNLQSIFILKNELTIHDNLSKACLVHVRRGDYKPKLFRLSKLKPLKLIYFDKSIELMTKIRGVNRFYIFSNDISWCKTYFVGEKFYFSDSLKLSNDLQEFTFMTKFTNFIISNSTFSFWAAYLSNIKDKFIIVPKNGFPSNDLIPNNWIKI